MFIASDLLSPPNISRKRYLLEKLIKQPIGVDLASRNEFPYLYHIDSRGNAKESDWFDELHLKPWA